MPVATIGFQLKPVGFFDRNPALDVPPSDAARRPLLRRESTMSGVEGRVALVTGAQQRHRRRDGAALAEGGAKLALASRRRRRPRHRGRAGTAVRHARRRRRSRAGRRAVERFGGLDILVANAGVGAYGDFLDLDPRVAGRDDRHQRQGLPATRSAPGCRTCSRAEPPTWSGVTSIAGQRAPRGRGGLRRVEARADRLHALARPRAVRQGRALLDPGAGRRRDRVRDGHAGARRRIPTWPACCGPRRWRMPSSTPSPGRARAGSSRLRSCR